MELVKNSERCSRLRIIGGRRIQLVTKELRQDVRGPFTATKVEPNFMNSVRVDNEE